MLRVFMIMLVCIQLLVPTGLYWNQSKGIARASIAVQSGYSELAPQMLPGLKSKVEVFEDEQGVPHIFAKKSSDVFFMQGFLHARDRFFQMDVMRRTAEGTLAELLGRSSLSGDVQLRAFGLARAAAAALPMLRPDTRKIIKDYTRGVNAYLTANPLPPEYQTLKITQKRMWTEVDSLTIGKLIAFGLSFNTNDISATLALQSYEAAGKAQGFNGTALFFEDTFRSAPFDPTFAIPDATGTRPNVADIEADDSEQMRVRVAQQKSWSRSLNRTLKPETIEMARNFVNTIISIPYLGDIARLGEESIGSNWYLLSGKNTESGAPLLNNDPHLGLSSPPVWYQVQLNVNAKGDKALNVTGVSFPGIPGVVLGHNDNIAWSATITAFDVTDIFQEDLVLTGFNAFAIVHNGKQEPVIFREETFKSNTVTTDKNDNVAVVPPSGGIFDAFPPPRVPIVPLRNNGPIVSINTTSKTALSIQYVGFGPTFEVEAFVDFNRAKSIEDFRKALQFFDMGSQNFGVVSTTGDIAYFTSGEVPLREDLEAGKVNGAPPFFIRNGKGGNDWQPLRKKQPQQALSTEILPFEEMPQVMNPARGFVVTANADPIGVTANNNPMEKKRANGGIYYIGGFYANGSRAARITRGIEAVINSGKKISVEQARRIQASVQMRDAEVLTPLILQAFANAKNTGAPPELAALASDKGLSEAVGRFSTWDFSTPTGLKNGFDSFVPAGSDPTEQQINNSVSATIYALWRAQIIRNVIDSPLAARQVPTVDGSLALGALRNLFDKFATRKGVGASGIDFFSVPNMPNATPEARRDLIILQSLRQALDILAGPDFQMAFSGSTNQRDYRWGILHRIVFAHPLGANTDYSIPSNTGFFHPPFASLPGLPRDGGVEVPNASGHNVRSRTVNGFMFSSGPSQRFTVVMKPGAIEASNALPGGQSGALTSRFRENLLNFWLVANVYPVIDKREILEQKSELTVFEPKK